MIITLAIESAIGGGSLALLRGDEVKGDSTGTASRAEQVLIAIDELLKKCSFQREDVDRIAVSIGPGSYTGIRVAIATALGFSKALNIDCIGVPLFEAICEIYAVPGETTLVAVQTGKDEYAWQTFGTDSHASHPAADSFDGLLEKAEWANTNAAFLSEELAGCINALNRPFAAALRIIPINVNLAKVIGQASLNRPSLPPSPIYLRRSGLRTGF
ncbi:MAG: tRNA (adenosine(37)-N6)-threonylcarbamoyltransferase complex dimerization subunit type 1 TsaB [Acidobacteria bacterium]|nr:tRNA (adenosine(37)-N6)-threonylcarbamoyltransferase complex dimerization subunit type 1 TsaB [Acidobacteriota bacterium]